MTGAPNSVSTIDVSVIVAVYNTGSDIEPCIQSLLAQTVPQERREFIFVDDGSTDGTGERLDEVAAEHPDVRVIHQENSGWPGRPRNTGIEAARGEFLQFLDHDDSLGPEALERLVEFGRANASDIIIGKVTSANSFRRTPQAPFKETVARCSIYDTPLIETLTPHKMFRRAFVLDNNFRFLEGRVRLEDQLFMIQAYFATRAVAIYTDYPCYFYRRRTTGMNAANTLVDPAVYFRFQRGVLTEIAAHTEPGEFRNSLYVRYIRQMSRRSGGLAVDSQTPPAHLAANLAEFRRTAKEFYNDAIIAGVPTMQQLQAQAILAERVNVLRSVTETFRALRIELLVEKLAWSGATWVLEITARCLHPDGSPMSLEPADGGWTLDRALAVDGLIAPVRSTEDVLRGATLGINLIHCGNDVVWPAPSEIEPHLEPLDGGLPDGPQQLVFRGTATIDPAGLGGVHGLDVGVWQVSCWLNTLDFERIAKARLSTTASISTTPVAATSRRAWVTPRVTPATRSLRFVVRRKPGAVRKALRQATSQAALHGKTLELDISAHLLAAPDHAEPRLVARAADESRTRLATTVRSTDSGTVVAADLTGLPAGRYKVMLWYWDGVHTIKVATITIGRLTRRARLLGS